MVWKLVGLALAGAVVFAATVWVIERIMLRADEIEAEIAAIVRNLDGDC